MDPQQEQADIDWNDFDPEILGDVKTEVQNIKADLVALGDPDQTKEHLDSTIS